jgi:hypothetical protein
LRFRGHRIPLGFIVRLARPSAAAPCPSPRPKPRPFFAVLPLAGLELMSDLAPALIHCDVAKDSLRLESEQRFQPLFGDVTTSPPYGVYRELAPGIVSCGLI